MSSSTTPNQKKHARKRDVKSTKKNSKQKPDVNTEQLLRQLED